MTIQAASPLTSARLLAHHTSKSINSFALSDFDLILTMDKEQKLGLPKEKTYILKEYAGLRGNVADPFGGDLDRYMICLDEIKDCLDKIVEKMLETRHECLCARQFWRAYAVKVLFPRQKEAMHNK